MKPKHPWMRHWPESVPHELSGIPFPHLPAMLRDAAARSADGIAFTQCMPNGMNGRLRYADVDRHSDAFATWLREVAGIRQGDRVALQMPNTLAYPVAAFGVLKAGCVLVNTNPMYTASEMMHQFADSGARVLVIIDMFADRLPDVLPHTAVERVVTVRIDEFFPPIIAGIIRVVQKYWDRALPPVQVEHTSFHEVLRQGGQQLDTQRLDGYLEGAQHDTLAALQYTGGTTGVSKGAMLSHGNLLTNTQQMLQMVGSHIRPGQETVLTALPLYHIFAFTVNLLGFYQARCHNVLVPSPRPPGNLKRAFENYPITWMTGVNTLFNALLNERWFLEYPPRRLRASVAGGMALHAPVAERWREVTGTPIVEGYGLTESAPVLSFNPLDGLVKDGSIGIPVPGTEMRCIGDNGQPVAPGESGEIVARGPQVMLGYWQRPEETEESLVDGWLRTGDIGVMDEDGYFSIVDRKKDMILVSGFNVYPNEVEDVIARVPGVREVGVVGVPDEKTGEAVHAYVVASEPPPAEAEIISHARQHLAAYKVPRRVEFRDELPKSLIGKILRRELRTDPEQDVPPGTLGFTPESTTGERRRPR
jgi:long-chain acyl-CoA synthetase